MGTRYQNLRLGTPTIKPVNNAAGQQVGEYYLSLGVNRWIARPFGERSYSCRSEQDAIDLITDKGSTRQDA